jgi:hypothetical protein
MFNKPVNIQEIQDTATERLEFTIKDYPDLPTESSAVRRYQQKHLALHLSKNIGAISAMLEVQDHGQEINPETMAHEIRKILVNSLTIGRLAGATADIIEQSFWDWEQNKIK